jgi:hypothetical protein
MHLPFLFLLVIESARLRIEISNSFIRDYERVIAFAAYINKPPLQGLTLRSECREYSYSLPSRKEEDESQGGLGDR